MHLFNIGLILSVVVIWKNTLLRSALGYKFKEEPSATWNSSLYRVGNPYWEGTNSTLTCARIIINSCPRSRGYFFDPDSGLCTPLIWLSDGPGVASNEVPAGDLHLTIDGLCPQPFQAVEYGSDKRVSCIIKIGPGKKFDEATSHCDSLGGYLASVKTQDKLAMLITFSGSGTFWLGADDIIEDGRWIWQEDGSSFNLTEAKSMFTQFEPDNFYGSENCLVLMSSSGGLADYLCYAYFEALCETSLLEPNC